MNNYQIQFTNFEVQKCLRINHMDREAALMLIHPEQDQSLLAQIEEGYDYDESLRVVVTMQQPGSPLCVVEKGDGPFVKAAWSNAKNCYIESGYPEAVVWRVAGFEEGHHDPIDLGSHDSASMAQSVCDALSAVLAMAKANGQALAVRQA